MNYTYVCIYIYYELHICILWMGNFSFVIFIAVEKVSEAGLHTEPGRLHQTIVPWKWVCNKSLSAGLSIKDELAPSLMNQISDAKLVTDVIPIPSVLFCGIIPEPSAVSSTLIFLMSPNPILAVHTLHPTSKIS
jgi:hypothetical protein